MESVGPAAAAAVGRPKTNSAAAPMASTRRRWELLIKGAGQGVAAAFSVRNSPGHGLAGLPPPRPPDSPGAWPRSVPQKCVPANTFFRDVAHDWTTLS